MRRKKFPYWLSLVFILAVGTASWAIYSLANTGISDILLKFGIENFYLQSLIIIGVVFLVLIFSGYGIKKSIDKLLK